MKRTIKLIGSALAVGAVVLAMHGRAHAKPEGSMPVRVDFSPAAAPSGNPVTMSVTMSDTASNDQNVAVSYDTVSGPESVTVPAGSLTGSATVYPSGNSGDTGTATAALNEGYASGSIPIQ